MSFFPLFPTSDVAAPVSIDVKIRIPSFSMDACRDMLHIAGGSFANVYSCTYEGQKHVVKKLNYVEDDDDGEQSLFMKEVALLDRLRGHQNIVDIAAFCYPKRALLMEYVSFSVECINLKAQPVYSLDKLLKVLLPGKFVGCTHLALNIAIDIATGLQFMHSRGVVHRDLKSANVLVSNSHYANLDESDVKKWWMVRPIVCKLTDFGESRSSAIKTRFQMTNTLSRNLVRGSPVYQAPEIYIGSKVGITVVEYKQMDIWSYAMILFDLMNPQAYPYKEEISKLPAHQLAHLFLEEKHKNNVLPLFPDRFQELQQSVWRPLRNVYDSCAVHLPSKRLSAKEIVIRLTNEHVEVQNLPVSQSTGGGKFSKRRRQNHEHVSSTRNACAFLAVIIADRLLKRVARGPVPKDVIIKTCTNAITKFPEEVNISRDLNEFYGINEAYGIVSSCNACDAYNIELSVFSQTAKTKSAAMDELKEALSKLVFIRKPFAALYVVPPNTVLLCSLTPMTLFVVDTHAVPKLNNGNDETGAVVTSMHGETAVTAIVNWLFSRLCKGKFVHHELGILSPLNVAASSKLAHDNSIEPLYTSVETQKNRMVRDLTISVTSISSTNANALHLPHNLNKINVNADSAALDMSCHSIFTAVNATTVESVRDVTEANSLVSPKNSNVRHPVICSDDGHKMGRIASSVTSISSIAAAGLDLSYNLNQVDVNADSAALDMSCHSIFTAVNATTVESVRDVTKANSLVSPKNSNVRHPVICSDDGHKMGRIASSVTSISSIAAAGLDLSYNLNQVDVNADSATLDMSCHSACTIGNTTVNRLPFTEIDNRYEPDTYQIPHSMISLLAAEGLNQLDNNESVVSGTSMRSSELAGGNNTPMSENVSLSVRAEKAKVHFSTVYSRLNTWENCQGQFVECLPAHIDDLQKYMIRCNTDEMMAVTKDSQPWNVWVTTSRKGFSGRRRMAKCRGSLACVSETCSFLAAHKCSNRVQFLKRDGNMVCFSCNSIAEYVSCPAVKIWEYHIDLHAVVVYHHGRHTCVRTPERPSSSVIVNAIKKYPRTPAVQILHNELVDCLRKDDVNEEDLEKVCKDFGSLRQIRHFQQLAHQADNPCGDNGFDAIISFKEKMSRMDKFLIYDVNGKSMNKKSAYVFKSSTDMAQLALEMDLEGSGFLKEEFAYVDVKHDRCRDYQTATLWTYHPSMRKLLRLAVMDIEQENTENLTLFWHIFNQMLREVSGQADYQFNPIGFISDEHHANFKAIKEVFGEVGAKRIKTCEFHFKQSVQRHMKYLDVQLRESFKQMAYNMLEAQSHGDCEAACVAMSSFCSRNVQVKSWYEWWYRRKEHIFRAFKATNTPSANIAEIGHAQMAAWARTNTTLLEAAIDDVAFAIRQKHDIQGFLEGKRTGGTGISVAKKRAKQHTADMKRAEAWAHQLKSQFDSQCTYVPSSGIHRPLSRSTKKLKLTNAMNVGAKKRLPVNKASQRSVRQRSGRSLPSADRENVEPTNSKLQSRQTTVNKQGDDKKFQVVFCTMAIKTCYGCHQPFRARYRKEPNNIILKVMCCRPYMNSMGRRVTSLHRQAAYLHLKLKCMQNYNLHASVEDIVVQDDIYKKISDEQVQLLHTFGVSV